MTATQVLRGVLRPDGTLELQGKPTLPAGPVQVTLQAEFEADRRDPWGALQQIWDERKALGLQSRSAEEIDAQIQAMRDEWEERQQEIEHLQETCRRDRTN